MLPRIQTTPVERKSHAQTVHDRAAAASVSLMVDTLLYKGKYLHLHQCLANLSQSLPFLVQMVSLWTINRQTNRLVLCDIRLMATSSTQDPGVSRRSTS